MNRSKIFESKYECCVTKKRTICYNNSKNPLTSWNGDDINGYHADVYGFGDSDTIHFPVFKKEIACYRADSSFNRHVALLYPGHVHCCSCCIFDNMDDVLCKPDHVSCGLDSVYHRHGQHI